MQSDRNNDICACACNRNIMFYNGVDYCQLCNKAIRPEIKPLIRVSIVDKIDDRDAIANVKYPDEGNMIRVIKGLNGIEISTAIHHEIGHLIDWYMSYGVQSDNVSIREINANIIGECIRFRESH